VSDEANIVAPDTLSDEDRAELKASSAISDHAIDGRGYVTATEDHIPWLRSVGFSATVAARVPALVIPVFSPDGTLHHYVMRPHVPFEDADGRVRKYETPYRVTNTIDTHPALFQRISDLYRGGTLMVTEGTKKADALVSQGFCAISINGCWGWRGRNDKGGLVALTQWNDVAIAENRVLLIPDSDYATNRDVRKGWDECRRYLASKRAEEVEILVPPAGPDGEKRGVDDYLAEGKTFADLRKAQDSLDGNSPLDGKDEPELTPEQLAEIVGDPREMMDALVAFYAKHLFASPWVHDLMAVWALHTHAIDAFATTAYLNYLSEEPDSGKSRALELLQMTCHEALTTMNVSDAALFRAIEQLKPTLLLDEMDGMLGDKNEKRMLVSMLNAGYRIGGGAVVLRIGGANRDELERFSAFCPKAFAGLEDILPPALHSRCLHVTMVPRLANEAGGDFIFEDELPRADALRKRLAAWGKLNAEELRGKRPAPVNGLRNRTWEVSRPLVSVALVLGGEWHERISEALSNVTSDKKTSWGVKLLEDCRTVFLAHTELTGTKEIAKSQMVHGLKELPDSPWESWEYDSNKLSRKLTKYGVPSDTRIGPEDARKRGWKLEDFEEAWLRHLPPLDTSKRENDGDAPSVQDEISVQSVQDEAPEPEIEPSGHSGRKSGAGRKALEAHDLDLSSMPSSWEQTPEKLEFWDRLPDSRREQILARLS
jgi:hypothetical protein